MSPFFTFSRLMDHMAECHPNSQFFGDSGTLDGSTQICFLCGVDLAKEESKSESEELSYDPRLNG